MNIDDELTDIHRANQSDWMRLLDQALVLGMFTLETTSEVIKTQIRQLIYQAIHQSHHHFWAYHHAHQAYRNIGDETSAEMCEILEAETNPLVLNRSYSSNIGMIEERKVRCLIISLAN